MMPSKSRRQFGAAFVLGVLWNGLLGAQPAPWGTEMPPNEIILSLEGDHSWRDDYWGRWDAQLEPQSEKPGSKRRAFIEVFGDKSIPKNPEIWACGMAGNFDDGEFVPFGGQIYEWKINETLRRGTFQRIPDHPLSVPPEKSKGVFTVFCDARMRFRNFPLEMPEIEKSTGASVTIDRDKIRLPGMNASEIGSVQLLFQYRHLGDTKSQIVADVGAGKVLHVGPWEFNVERIVFPDAEKHLRGWVDLRIQASKPQK